MFRPLAAAFVAGAALLVISAPIATANPVAVKQQGASVYYQNCDAARAAGVAPLYRDDPGYREELDRDADGVACEPKR
jgi:Excalibur calcium-binding domain